MQVYLNGAFVDRAAATVSVDDRGFLFGDGLYEVVRVVRGTPFELAAHLARLADGVRALALPEPPGGLAALPALLAELVARNGLTGGEATLYLQLTRGAAPRTHAFPPAGTPPTFYAAASPFTPNAAAQRDGVAAITHPDIRWARCDIKTVNLLPNAWAKQRAVEAGAFEAVFLRDGALTDGASTNVFAVVDGELRTPPLTNYLLPGITRRVVLELARELGLPVAERLVPAEELPRATELLLTGTTTDVTPVVRLDGRPVGDGRPGPITRALHAALRARLDAAAAAAPASEPHAAARA